MSRGTLTGTSLEGEVLACDGDAWLAACTGTTATPTDASPEKKPSRQLPDAEVQRELAAMHRLHDSLKARVEQLESEVQRKGQRLAEMAAEVSCQGVSTSALRHEVRVKAALLGHVQAEALRREEDRDAVVERLMAKAMSTLATIVPPEQLAVSAAEGQRVSLLES